MNALNYGIFRKFKIRMGKVNKVSDAQIINLPCDLTGSLCRNTDYSYVYIVIFQIFRECFNITYSDSVNGFSLKLWINIKNALKNKSVLREIRKFEQRTA